MRKHLQKNLSFIYWFLVLLSIIPLWILPIAPLADWPIHLAISNQAYLQLNGHTNDFFHLDFTFISYSFTHLLLVALQYLFSLEISGKIVLSLLYLFAPACWHQFFSLLAPEKKSYFIIGSLMNYSLFFYFGTINYLFACHFGLLLIAYGLNTLKSKNNHAIEILILCILTTLSHGFMMLFCSSLLFLAYYKQRIWDAKDTSFIPIAIASLFSLLIIYSSLSNTTLDRDSSYLLEVSSCLQKEQINSQGGILNMGSYLPKTLLSKIYYDFGSINPVFFFESIFPLKYIVWTLPFLFIGFLISASASSFLKKSPLSKKFPVSHFMPSFNRIYLMLFILMLILFLLVPNYLGLISGFGDRSLIFAIAFLALAIESKSLQHYLPKILAILLALNILYQAAVFSNHYQEQQKILSQLKEVSEKIPKGSTIFIKPTELSSESLPKRISAYYHSFLLVYNPDIYVSGLFLYQDTFILRTSFDQYSDFALWGPKPYEFDEKIDKIDIHHCYDDIPEVYDYYTDEDLNLHKND